MHVVFSADGQMLASGSKDKKGMIWNIQPHRALTMMSNVTSRPVFSADSRLVAASVGQNKVVAWDVATFEEKALFAGAFDAVAFSPDGRSIMTRSTNYFLRTYDVATQAVRQTISSGPSAMTNSQAALSPDGTILATGWPDGTLTFCDAKTGAAIAPVSHAYSNVFFKLVFSPNGKFLATAGRGDGTGNAIEPMIWDEATHQMVKALAGHTELVLDAAFAPDGKTLLTCGNDDSIRFWDTTSWKEIPPYLRQKQSVSAIAISPNGRTLASACNDGTVKLWNLATHKEVASLESGGVQSLAFSPDSRTLAAFEWDHSLHLWRAPPDSEFERH
jgi:WD40 repeat protein